MTPADRYNAIIKRVAAERYISVEAIRGKSRDRYVYQARQDIAKELYDLGLSTTQIGKYLNRDHTTILYMMGRLNRNKKK